MYAIRIGTLGSGGTPLQEGRLCSSYLSGVKKGDLVPLRIPEDIY